MKQVAAVAWNVWMLTAAVLLGAWSFSVSAEDGMMIRAVDYGVVGDGKTDDTEALANAFGAACGMQEGGNPRTASRRLLLPAGTMRITATITLTPEHNGLMLVGQGGFRGYGSAADSSCLLWDGDEGGTLLQCWSMKGLQMTDIVVDGSKKAGKLLRVNSTDPSNKDQTWFKKYGQLASTGYTLTRVTFQNAQKGIVLSDDAYICSDCSSFYNVAFKNLDTGFEANSEQNLCYLFERPDIGYVGTAFKFVGGGSVQATGVNAHHTDVVFDISRVGINSGTYNLINVRPEQGAREKGKRPVILKVSGEANIKLVGAQTTACAVAGPEGDQQTPAFILGPSANVVVESSQLCGKVAQLTGSAADVPTFITFRNSRFRLYANPLDGGIEHDENSGYRLEDCQVVVDGEEDGKYKVFSRSFVDNHAVLPQSCQTAQ